MATNAAVIRSSEKVSKKKLIRVAKVRNPYAISAKRLAELNTPHSCPRCFLIRNQLHGVGRDTPFSFGVAGILSRLDSLQKNLIKQSLPGFLKKYAGAELIAAHRMTIQDEKTGIEISGVPDLIFRKPDGKLIVIDLKSSKPKTTPAAADKSAFLKVVAIYTAQLSAYKWMLEKKGMGIVDELKLLYLWPQGMDESTIGVEVQFEPTEVAIQVDDMLIPRLLVKARDLLHLKQLPPPQNTCLDCVRLAHLLTVVGVESKQDEKVLSNVKVFVP